MSSASSPRTTGIPLATAIGMTAASVLATVMACEMPAPEDADIGCIADAKASPLCANYVAPEAGTGAGGARTDEAGGTGDVAAPTDDAAADAGDTIAPNGPAQPEVYATFGPWQGYCLTGSSPAGANIPRSLVCGEASDPCTVAPGAAFCATGVVPRDTTYASLAFLACNVAQAQTADPATAPVGTVVTSGTGLEVHLSGNTKGLRVTLQGDTAGNVIWCADVPAGGSGKIPWSTFDSQCWFGNGTKYAVGTPITSVVITVPSSPAATPFAFCLDSIGQY